MKCAFSSLVNIALKSVLSDVSVANLAFLWLLFGMYFLFFYFQPVYVWLLIKCISYKQRISRFWLFFFLPSLTICFWIGLFNTFILSLSIYIVGYMSAICCLFSVCLRSFSFLSIFSLLPSFVLNIFSVPFKFLCQLCVCLCVFVLCISVSFTYHNLFYINPYLIPVKYRNFATA